MNVIDKILDDDNDENIILKDKFTGEEMEFEQIATINIDEQIYVILVPVRSNDVFEEGEALVWKIEEDDDEYRLVPETNDDIIDKVMDEYFELYEKTFSDDVSD